MQNFIDKYLYDVNQDFYSEVRAIKKNGGTLCSLNYSFQNPSSVSYSNKLFQLHYLLRFAYAYILEYHFLYSKLHLKNYNVFSIGCGSLLDLYGLYFAKQNEKIAYYGIDICDWAHKENLLAKNQKFDKVDLSGCLKNKKKDILKFNTIVFPKSIDSLSQTDIQLMSLYIRKNTFSSDVIYLILNGMENISNDLVSFDAIKDAFVAQNYRVTEMFERTSDLPKTFVELPERIELNLDLVLYKLRSMMCGTRKKPTGCIGVKNCSIDKDPILKTDSFKYKIYRLERG